MTTSVRLNVYTLHIVRAYTVYVFESRTFSRLERQSFFFDALSFLVPN